MKKPTPFGKYYLLERINVGGMAEVFRAKAFGVEGFERLVAVKRILPNIAEDKDFIRMFIEEAKLAVQLNHANIAQIYDLGVNDGAYYIALEHIHGRDVRAIFDRCRTGGEAMPVAQACFIVMKVCEGLDYAHNKRDQSGRELSLVHRDVSPQNVLVSFEGEVKIIDFGIAKAAGKGSKTQAGILKGKFGYMSPEQVRGIPIDRRSDVFSCGIVLYELLTGERLFVGESDFSTLEKVRNVEILPPSTYNRRIPDELERIVLKALAKDTDERYQNAIDLHDELQAFVYTAGEFYSRKDLAGWMKKTFGREIEEETAKLDSYRQLKPPPSAETPAPQRTPSAGSRPPPSVPTRRATQGIAAVSGTKPPPPPSSRASQQLPVAPAPSAAGAAKRSNKEDSGDLAWDDDELETQIYDNPEDDPRNKKPSKSQLPLGAPLQTPSPAAAAAAPQPPPLSTTGPDLSSLVNTAKSWEGGKPTIAPGVNGTNGTPAHARSSTAQQPQDPMVLISTSHAPPPVSARETVAPNRLVQQPEPLFDPMASFGSGMLRQVDKKNKGLFYIAIGGAAVAVVAVVVVIAMTNGKKPDANAGPNRASATPPVAAVGDQNTGFDLYVSPPGVTTWRLDGEPRTDRLPSRIRGISPGAHTVAIDAPAGFMSQNQPVAVEAGKAPKIEITLQAIAGITGKFESTPPGAEVSLIIDGKREPIGASPAKAPLDPRKSYQVLFEKPGYVSVNRPIVFTGQMDERVIVNLEKAGPVATTDPVVDHKATAPPVTDHKVTTPPPGGDHKVTPPPPGGDHKVTPTGDHKVTPTGPVVHPDPKSGGDPKVAGDTKVGGDTGGDTKTGNDTKPAIDPKPAGKGTLTLGSKPVCDIFIDGKDIGQHTPQKNLPLSAGPHKITLVNNEFGIKETFKVDIKPDQAEKAIKDFSDRLPK